jgi:hypothetical protein
MSQKFIGPGWQARAKQEHEDAIISLLGERPLRFKDIAAEGDKTDIHSQKGLTEVLTRLKEKDLIEISHAQIDVIKKETKGARGEILKEAKIKKDIEVYRLTDAGKAHYAKMWDIIRELQHAKNKGADYINIKSYNYYSFGFSQAKVVVGKTRLDSLLPKIGEIEDVYFRHLITTMRENKLKLKKPEDAKTILTFEFDWKKFSEQIAGLDIFLDDITRDKDFLTDERLYSETEDKIWTLERLVNNAVLYNPDLRKRLAIYLNVNLTKSYIKSVAEDIDFDSIDKLIVTIKDGGEPLDNEELKDKLVSKSETGSLTTDTLIFTYLKIAGLLAIDNHDLHDKITNYMQKLSTHTINQSDKKKPEMLH